MTSFVDPHDPAAVTAVLQTALTALGMAGLLQQLAAVPGLAVALPQPAKLFRPAVPGVVAYGDRTVRCEPSGRLQVEHVVGAVVLSREAVPPVRAGEVLAGLVRRAVEDTGRADDVSVQLTALRDAVAAAG